MVKRNIPVGVDKPHIKLQMGKWVVYQAGIFFLEKKHLKCAIHHAYVIKKLAP